jgi:hypothetical protein
MAGEDNPFAKYAGQTAPVVRPSPVERPDPWASSGGGGQRKKKPQQQIQPEAQPPFQAQPVAAPVAEKPAAPAEENPFEKFAGKSVKPHGAGPGGKEPSPVDDFDVTGTHDDVRSRIAALPEKHRQAALAKWADAEIAKERGDGSGQALDDYMRRAVGGVIGDWGDRLGKAMNVQSLSGMSDDEAYAKFRARTRAAHKATDKTVVATVPKFNVPLVGEVGGDISTGDLAGLAGGAAAAPFLPVARVAKALPYLRQAPNALLSRMTNYGTTGAGYGAILGAGSGETTDERIDNAKKGALIGGLLGAGAPVAGSAVGGVAGRVRDAVAPMPRELQPYARGAVDRMATAFEHDAPGNTATFGSEGMLADLGENMRNTAGALAATPGPNMQMVRDAVVNRRLGAANRIEADVNATLGPAQNLVQLEQQVTDTARRAAGPHYREFYDTPVQATPRLQQFLDFAEQHGVVRAADEAMARETVLNGVAPSPNMRLDFIKRQFDRMADWAGTAQAGLDRHAAGQFRRFASEFRTEVDRALSQASAAANPNRMGPSDSSWARARHHAGEGLAFQDGLEEGRQIFSKATHPDQMAADMAGMSVPQNAGYVAGGRGAIRDMMGNAAAAYGSNADIAALKGLNSRYAQQKFEHLVGPQDAARLGGRLRAEAEFNRTYDDVLRNSKTAVRQAVQEGLPNLGEGGGSGFATPGHAVSHVVGRIVDTLTSGLVTARNTRILRDMADMVVAQGIRREEVAAGLRQYIVRTGVTGQVRGQIDRMITQLLRGAAHGGASLEVSQGRPSAAR